MTMSRDDAEAHARERLTRLAACDEPGGNPDWNLLSEAARRALGGDRSAAAVFRRVFEEPGFAASSSNLEIGYAALGIALCGDRGALPHFALRSMPFNGISDDLAVARVLLAPVR